MRHAESEAQFSRFAPAIGQALDAYPNAIKVDPSPIAVETYTARFRDAVKAKWNHGWESSWINNGLFASRSKELKTHMGDGFVLLGTRDGIKRYLAKSVGEVLTADNKPELTISFPTLDIMRNLCFMLSTRTFTPAPSFIVTMTSKDVSDLEELYDVSFLPIPNRPDFYRLT